MAKSSGGGGKSGRGGGGSSKNGQFGLYPGMSASQLEAKMVEATALPGREMRSVNTDADQALYKQKSADFAKALRAAGYDQNNAPSSAIKRLLKKYQ